MSVAVSEKQVSAPNAANEARTGTLSREAVEAQCSNELFLALVGPVGSGCSRVAKAMQTALKVKYDAMNVADFECVPVKVSDLIRSWAEGAGKNIPPLKPKTLGAQERMQQLGDEMRNSDHAAVAVAIVQKIKELRAVKQNQQQPSKEDSVQPNGKSRVYVIDSLKNPAEAELLRLVYRDAFALIAVVCEPKVREQRVISHYFMKEDWESQDAIKAVKDFIEKDSADNRSDAGQQVTDTFHLADFFLDNSGEDTKDVPVDVTDQIGRLVDLITRQRVVRPTQEETAMHAASSAQRRSACLSRQVGAALVDSNGDIVSTGSNEVPRPGGGTYASPARGATVFQDHRCAFSQEWQGCRSTRQQWLIIDRLIEKIPELAASGDKSKLRISLKKTEIGDLIEFSRAVHAEMDAILSAARSGRSTVGGRLFVTTFPCHYCARHIIAAGVHEVQYIEPYPKSQALELHQDAIEQDFRAWIRPLHASEQRDADISGAQELSNESVAVGTIALQESIAKKNETAKKQVNSEKQLIKGSRKVLFKPFVGVAPRLYVRVFLQDRKNKDEATGAMKISPAKWGGPWALSRLNYADLERAVTVHN